MEDYHWREKMCVRQYLEMKIGELDLFNILRNAKCLSEVQVLKTT